MGAYVGRVRILSRFKSNIFYNYKGEILFVLNCYMFSEMSYKIHT